MGILTVDSRHMQRKHKRVQFDVLVSRTADEPFVSVGQIDGELDGFITIQSLKAEGSQTFANSEGFNNIIRFSVATQSLLDNTSIFNIETIDKGLWYVQFKEVYGTINFVTPFPVSLKITAGIRTGNHKSQSTLIETFFYTTDLDWIKDSRPPAPLLIKPEKLATGNPPHPPSQTIDLSDGITFRLSNPAVKPILQELTLYDIRIYSDAFQQNEVASKLNLTKSQIIDADYIVTSNTQLTGFSNLERGRKYYVHIIAKYLGLESPPLDFAIAFGFTAPSLSDYPTSIEYPTQTSFQVTTQRNTANANNANANQVEFEWRIGVDVQGIVSAVYNNAGQATGIFQIPSGLNSGNTIFVKARSKNSVVIGEWSNDIEISVALFRPLPNILSFTASQSKVALSAQPPTQVFFSIQFSYNDAFSGICTWKIERVDNMQLISSGVQTSNPHFVSNISVPLPSVSSKTTLTYRLTVTNPNNQSVTSDINIEYISRPAISDVFFFFNPNFQTYQDVSKSALANQDGHPVGLIEDELDSIRKVEQQTVTNKPVLKASGNRFFLESSVAGRNLRQPESDNALPTDFSQRDNFSWIMVGNFPDRGGEICQPMNLGIGSTDIILGFWIGDVVFRLGTSISPDIILPNTPYNTHNIMQVVVVTYQRNTTNGFKVYSSLYPTSGGRLVDQKNTTNNTLGGSNNDRMIICRSRVTNLIFPRQAGHIISFKKTLSQSEALAWIDWLCAYYQITPAP